MRRTAATVARVAAVAALAALYYWLSHVLTAADRPSSAGALLSLGPYMGVALLLAWKSRRRGAALGLWTLAAAALALNWPLLRDNFEWIYLIQHAGAFTLLAVGFGRTLADGETPMISRFAERIHGALLPPPLASYTRGATLAWTLFFAAVAAVSLLLFFAAPIQWWSVFANLLTPFLIGLMFLAEYLVRRQRLPREFRTGLVESIRAVLGHRRQQGCELPGLGAHTR